MPPDSNGSGASPADPDQPTQAPPRPATKGSSAVTRPPGLRCQRVSPSAPTTWSTGSLLATTTTGLSAPTRSSELSPIPLPSLSGQQISGRCGTETEHERGDQVGQGAPEGALLHQPDDVGAEGRERGEGAAEAGADERHHPAGRGGEAEHHAQQPAAGDVGRQRAPGGVPAAPARDPDGQQPQWRPGE